MLSTVFYSILPYSSGQGSGSSASIAGLAGMNEELLQALGEYEDSMEELYSSRDTSDLSER